MTTAEFIESSREAMARNAWAEAYDLWHRADESQEIGPLELEEYALCAWWTGQPDRCIDIRERAYAAYNVGNNTVKAGMLALKIAEDHFHKGSGTLARCIATNSAQRWYAPTDASVVPVAGQQVSDLQPA